MEHHTDQIDSASRGQAFERQATEWLVSQGCRILARNVRYKVGEIDIIALHRDVVVFAEVRKRSNARFAGAAASVDRRKQLRLLRAASLFLQSNPRWAEWPCRFDVLAFEPRQSAADSQPRWIRGAFTA